MPVVKQGKRARTRSALLVAVQELLLDPEVPKVSVHNVVVLASVAHGTFYNYFDSVQGAIEAVGGLLLAEHFRTVLRAIAGAENAAEVVVRSDLQTLMLFAHRPDVGRIVFDSGEPLDGLILLKHAREQMLANVEWGVRTGVFSPGDIQAACSIHIGAIVGACLDIHRGRLSVNAAPELASRLLRDLGVNARKCRRLVSAPQEFEPWRPLPLSDNDVQGE